MEDYKEYT